ncbi:MAG: sulfatase-like hydrolase/transferase [Deltaproteobacteria bacterium]|nr:sulfatase-like hydrolase/transferase [Deltaproteobacteria bacterium]
MGPDRVYEEFARLIDRHADGVPFFIYLYFMDVHQYAAPYEFKTFGSGEMGDYLAAIRWVDDTLQRVRKKTRCRWLSGRHRHRGGQ